MVKVVLIILFVLYIILVLVNNVLRGNTITRMMEYILKWAFFTYFVFYVLVVLGLGTIGENFSENEKQKIYSLSLFGQFRT